MSSFLGGIYIAHKKTLNVGITTFSSAIINLVIDFALIKKIGITAGSISTLVAYFALYVYRMIDLKKIQKMNFKIAKQIFYISFLTIIICISYINGINMSILLLINIVIGSIFFIIVNKNYIRTVLLRFRGVKNENRNINIS